MSYGAGLIPIARSILSSPAASITFSNIPQSFSHLFITITGATSTTTRTQGSANIRVNGDSSNANYPYVQINNGSGMSIAQNIVGTTSLEITPISASGTGDPAGASGSGGGWFPFYKETNFQKTTHSTGAEYGTSIAHWNVGCTWKNTAAITSLTVLNDDGTNLITGTAVTLYGLL